MILNQCFPSFIGLSTCFLDNAIQNIILEAPWFKSSQRLCAYVSCSALREVDTSRLLSEILQHQPKGVFLLALITYKISEIPRDPLGNLTQSN